MHVSIPGIAIAIAFALLMAGLMIWMFRLPRPVPAEVARARRALDAARLILVPTTQSPYSQRGVELACRLAQEQRAEILLLYVVEVPRTLQLDAPLPRAEEDARGALETARELVSMHNLPVTTSVWRAREASTGIIEAARQHDADLIVMSIGPRRGTAHGWGRTTEALLHRSPTEVIFDKVPE